MTSAGNDTASAREDELSAHLYRQVAGAAERRYPGVAAHLRGCGPCGEDFAACSQP